MSQGSFSPSSVKPVSRTVRDLMHLVRCYRGPVFVLSGAALLVRVSKRNLLASLGTKSPNAPAPDHSDRFGFLRVGL